MSMLPWTGGLVAEADASVLIHPVLLGDGVFLWGETPAGPHMPPPAVHAFGPALVHPPGMPADALYDRLSQVALVPVAGGRRLSYRHLQVDSLVLCLPTRDGLPLSSPESGGDPQARGRWRDWDVPGLTALLPAGLPWLQPFSATATDELGLGSEWAWLWRIAAAVRRAVRWPRRWTGIRTGCGRAGGRSWGRPRQARADGAGPAAGVPRRAHPAGGQVGIARDPGGLHRPRARGLFPYTRQ